MPLRLLVTIGPDMGKVFELPVGRSCVIGRGEDCDIQLTDARISRNHCRVTSDGGRAMLLDLKSAWGTLVNGQKVESHALQPNDVITLSESQLRFEVSSDAVAATWAPGASGPAAASQPVATDSALSLPATPRAEDRESSSKAAKTSFPKTSSLEQLIGQTLHRYEIQSLVATGKTGVVYQARDTKHDRRVALKVLWPEFSQNEEEMQRFVRAIKSMAPIRHPNLVHIHGAGKTGPYCWTATELLDADSLARRLELAGESRSLTWKLVLSIALDITRALQAAEKHQVVHRNITPNNILIDRKSGLAKLGDLMLAKALEGGQAEKITRAGQTVGDLAFLAPEQLLHPETSDTRADIYSLGATIYAALSGRPAITGGTLSETLRNIQTAAPARLRDSYPAIPAELETIVLRMLAKNPKERFASADELLSELEILARMHGVMPTTTLPQPPAVQSEPASAVSADSDSREPAAWVPKIVVTESGVTSKRNTRRTPGTKKRKSALVYAGGLGGALLLLAGILRAVGFFGGDAKSPARNPVDLATQTTTVSEGQNAKGGIVETVPAESTPTVTLPMELPVLIQQVEPSVARIDVSTFEGDGSGSGFVVDDKGTLVTNFHVIAGADKATAVFADGKQVRIEGVWHLDPERDIAILQLSTFGVDLKPLRLSQDLPPKGESVIAFGAPLGFDFTASEGIVSGLRRAAELEGLGFAGHQGTWVQTTAPISPGNSGGPLVNRKGEVVAINTLTISRGQNLNLAISALDIRAALQSRSAEPEPFSEFSKKTLLAEYGLNGTPGERPLDVTFDPDTLKEIKRLMAAKSQPLKAYADNRGPRFSEQQSRWEKQIQAEYDRVGRHDPRWNAEVKEFMDRLAGKDGRAVKEAAQAVVEAGCQDPAALMLCALTFLPDRKALAVGKQAERELAASKYSLSARNKLRLLFLAIQTQFAEEQDSLAETLEEVRQEYFRVLRDADLPAVERRMIYGEARRILANFIQGREIEFLGELDSAGDIDPWLEEMLSGLIHHQLGWRARGTGYADDVPRQQWDIFRAKVAQAQSHWLRAWRIEPEFPEAATELLRSTMASQAVAGEDERFWFERAVEAQFDYEPAYEAYLWAIRPRWGGSHDKMLAFGRECMETERYDTLVPWQFHEAVQAVASELGEDGSQIYRRLGIADDYLKVLKGYRKEAQDPARQYVLDSQTACVLLLAGRSAEAKKLIEGLGDNIDERGFEAFGVDMATLLESLSP